MFSWVVELIGIKNIKSKEQYKIGESLTFGGLAVDKAKMNSNKGADVDKI